MQSTAYSFLDMRLYPEERKVSCADQDLALTKCLLSITSLVLLIGFVLIYFSFNYFAKDYIYRQTRDSMQANFATIDSRALKATVSDYFF